MISKDEAKVEIRKLIEYYNSKKSEFDKSSELDVRHKLIDKLFSRLGWDLGGDENPDEVQREEGVKDEQSKKKKADYVFRLNGFPEFVVEAKAIKGVDMNEEKWKEQAVGYSYNLACSWAVLTNFVRIDIFYVDRNDTSPIRRINDLSDLSSFDENFERLWLLSKESAGNNYLEKEAEKLGIRPTREKVGKQLYEDLKVWRTKISNNIRKKYNDKYKPYEIEEIVQKIIDRLIFIRKLEDLELEERKLDQLIRKFSGSILYYRELKEIFKYYKEKYNSGLFGDKEEQECDRIDVDNDIVESVILGMYKPKGSKIEYNFSAIDADVLGNIYEQYLAYILQGTPKKAKLEGGGAHRKEQGIYYTPTYIVNYIVKHTVGEYLKNKTIDEILGVKIVDPACGSGSFLIRAFSEVCSIIERKLKNKEKMESSTFKKYDGRLNLAQKTTILTRCIYGVDLDKKAVEIAQLNLLLKLLEGETSETISNLGNTKKLLPMLTNIKNGNSLIDDETVDKEHFFKWKEKFPFEFDVVIGNPPYIRVQIVKEKDKDYLTKNYLSARGKFDLYVLFIEKSLKILKDRGYFSFIIPNKFAQTKYGRDLKKFILDDFTIQKFIDFGDLKVFGNVTTYPSILLIKNLKYSQKIKGTYVKVKGLSGDIGDLITKNENKEVYSDNLIKVFKFDQSSLNSESWSFLSNDVQNIFDKIVKCSDIRLGDIADKIYEGFITGNNAAFFMKKEDVIKLKIEEDLVKPVPKGKNVRRYSIDWNDEFILFPHIKNKSGKLSPIDLNSYPNAKKYLEQKKSELSQRGYIIKSGKEWYEIWNTRNIGWFEQDKIITPNLSSENNFMVDFKDNKINEYFYIDHDCYGIILKNKSRENYLYHLAILNSKLMEFFIKQKSPMFSGGYYKYHKQYLENIPIVYARAEVQSKIISNVNKIISFNKEILKLEDKKTDEMNQLQERVTEINMWIDQEVYKLYGITPEEQKVIEESLG